jgi:hypothetical protein
MNVIKKLITGLFSRHNQQWPDRPIRIDRMNAFIQSCTEDELIALLSACSTIEDNKNLIQSVYSRN